MIMHCKLSPTGRAKTAVPRSSAPLNQPSSKKRKPGSSTTREMQNNIIHEDYCRQGGCDLKPAVIGSARPQSGARP